MTHSREPGYWEKLRAIYHRVLDESHDERERILEQACGEDRALRAEIEDLLSADVAAGQFLEPPSPTDAAAFLERLEKAGTPAEPVTRTAATETPSKHQVGSLHIDGYELIRELARGGQGVVYQAVQLQTNRKVAIKVLLEGPFASESSRKRFEREIELVAQLKHPHIVSVLHSGFTPDGHHFYAMDYIRGVPLNRYVRDEKPTLEAVLQLFSKVCNAVQFAHYRGIIHRDLKPSNILIDADGDPKLLDFGLAKWVAAPSRSMISVSEAIIGTLPYMSPEQTRGNPDEIDTRTDIYALGVILYEALTGQYPYPVVGQMADVLRNIAEHPPDPPTTTWSSTSGITKRLTRTVRPGQCPIESDLQTIVLKTLAKERERRYQSAGDLAAEVQRFLRDEPIEARRDSALYVLRKLLSRHREKAAAAGLLLVLVTTFAAAIQWQRQAAARELKQQQLAAADDQRQAQAESLARQARAADQTFGRHAEARRLFDEARRLAPDHFVVNAFLANFYKREYFRKPLPYRDHTELKEAARLCNDLVAHHADHPNMDTVWNLKCVIELTLGNLGEANDSCRQALRINPQRFHAASNLAKALAVQGRFDEAIEEARQGIRMNEAAAEKGQYDDGIWLTQGTLLAHLKDSTALMSLDKAIELDNEDERNWFMRSRLKLLLNESPESALRDAWHAVELTRDFSDPRMARIVALVYLRNERFDDAVAFALMAIKGGDWPCYGHYIRAIAEAGRANFEAARYQLELADASWPAELEQQSVYVTAEKGLLWFDWREELESLQREAEEAVAAARN